MNINTAQRGAKLYARREEKVFEFQHFLLLTILLRDFIARGSVPVFIVLSLSLNKERTKESQPKAAAFGNCSRAALESEAREVTYILSILCLNSCHHARQAEGAKCFCYPVGKNIILPFFNKKYQFIE